MLFSLGCLSHILNTMRALQGFRDTRKVSTYRLTWDEFRSGIWTRLTVKTTQIRPTWALTWTDSPGHQHPASMQLSERSEPPRSRPELGKIPLNTHNRGDDSINSVLRLAASSKCLLRVYEWCGGQLEYLLLVDQLMLSSGSIPQHRSFPSFPPVFHHAPPSPQRDWLLEPTCNPARRWSYTIFQIWGDENKVHSECI